MKNKKFKSRRKFIQRIQTVSAAIININKPNP